MARLFAGLDESATVRSSSPPRACSTDAAESRAQSKEATRGTCAACAARAACACSLEGRRPKKPGVTTHASGRGAEAADCRCGTLVLGLSER